MMPKRFALVLCALALASPALAHPHVYVTAKAELAYAADGKMTAIRHAWTFDPAYSAYSTQGLDKNNNGVLEPDELQELAKINTESLAEYAYFSVLKLDGVKQVFDAPRDAMMTFDKGLGQTTLTFTLPLKSPALAKKALALEIFNSTFFVAFAIADGADAVTLAAAPKGCIATVTRAKGVAPPANQDLSESFLAQLNASSSGSFANRVLVVCP